MRVRLRVQYEESFSTLLNESLQYAPDRTSLVTHHMMVRACRTLTLIRVLTLTLIGPPDSSHAGAHCMHTARTLHAHGGSLCAAKSSSCRCTRRCWCSSSRGWGEARRAAAPSTACVRRASCDGPRRCCARRAGSSPSPSMTAPSEPRGRYSTQP